MHENQEEDDINSNNTSPVKTNQNENNLPNKNILLTNRSSKVTTKISKLVYDPPKQSTRAIIKTTYTYGNKTPAILVTESTPVENDKIKTFKAGDNNKFSIELKKSIESLDITNPSNKQDEFEKKRIEREKDIEDIQKMLNQINTSCHENIDEYQATLKMINSNNTVDEVTIVTNESETNIPINIEKEINLNNNVDVTFSTTHNLPNQIGQRNSKGVEQIQNTNLLKSASESEMNLRRSQTDMNIKTKFLLSPKKPISSRTGTSRSKSSINLFSRDTSKLNLETTKKKSYDPNEARRFMKAQRKKRQQIKNEQKGSSPKTNKNTAATTGGIDKEAIKKRLEDLRKSTLKILEKNVKVKEKQKVKKIEHHEDVPSNPNTVRSNKTILRPSNTKGILKLEKPGKDIETIKEKTRNKKIGLLRKPENEENSFSALKDFNINKENLNINLRTPVLKESTQQMDQGVTRISDTVIFKKISESKFENNENINRKPNSNNGLSDLELKIPDNKLERKVSLREKSTQVDPQSKSTPTTENTRQKELPYWLKPTPVQYYPYNFIMAVRKKLEAITNPVVSDNIKQQKQSRNQRSEIKKTQETPLTYPKDRKENVRRRIADEKNFNLNVNESVGQNKHINTKSKFKNVNTEKSKSVANENDNYGHSSKSISEITSNFSSISIHVPESHTISDISSIRSDIASNKAQKSQKSFVNSKKLSDQQNNILNKLNFIHDDDTTISSSIFSSPEKKIKKSNSSVAAEFNKNVDIGLATGPLSPLSVDNINKLQIKSKSNLDKVNLERGTGNNFDIQMLQLTNNTKLEIRQQKKSISSKTNSSHSTQKSDNLDFSQLLEDFNKSLSQVIEVNQQLKETLKKSNQMLSPNKNKTHKFITERTTETENYTSDFENDTTNKLKLNSGNIQNELYENNYKNIKSIPKGSIQSKTDEYTSDFEEEPTSVENVENSPSNASINTAKSEILLSIPLTKPSLLSIPEKFSSISSNSTKAVEKYDENINDSQVQENFKNEKQITNTSQEFLDSIEEMSKIKTASISENITESIYKNKEILENVIIEEENSIKKNQEISKFSKDLLDSVSESKSNFIKNHINNSRGDFNDNQQIDDLSHTKSDFIKNHINNSRGDFNTNQQIDDLKSNTTVQHTESSAGPPAYKLPDNNQTKETTNSSIGSEFIAVFNRSDIEVSIYSQNESSLSEATLNYSSIGMYEKLLQTETCKSNQLAALLKMREKALMDRTKGQIAWLEVQKEKYKSRGETTQISHIKKKQRAILMKMEKEREEIKKLILNQKPQLSARSNISDRQQLKLYSCLPKLAENISDISIRKNSTKSLNKINTTTTTTTSTTITSKNNIVRGFEIQSNQNLEKILQKREEELRKRRAHVECLMEWHQRLDKEEEEVFQLERMLFEHNVAPSQQQQNSTQQSDLQSQVQYQPKKDLAQLKRDKKIIEIDKSLRDLQNISCKSTDSTGNQNPDYVRTTGNKLNKLWSRLTGQKHVEKFDVKRKYKLYKNDLEKLYEEAKEEVLREFDKQQGMMDLFDQSKCLETSANSLDSENKIVIPNLNLNFSSGQSDIENNINISSIFYESTIQKQLQSMDLLEIDQETDLTEQILVSKVHPLEQITELSSENSEKIKDNESSNFVKSESEKLIHKEIFNQLVKSGREHIKNSQIETKIVSELLTGPIEIDPKITEESNLTDKYNSSTSKITPLTEISNITTENKTSDDITSLSLEEENKSENSKSVVIDSNSSEILKLNQTTKISPVTSTKIQSDTQESEQNSITNQILEENNTITGNILSKNVERTSVIINPTLEKSCEKLLGNVNLQASLDISITEKLSKADTVLSVNTASIEETAKLPEETNPNFTEELSKSDKYIEEISNIENLNSKPDCSDTLEKSDSLKYEVEISSETLESAKILNNSKKKSESPAGISSDTFVLSEQISNNSPIQKVSQIQGENIIDEIEEYENDFSGSDMTFLEDITAPKFESTMEETKSNLDDSILEENHSNHDEKSHSTSELEKRLIDLDVSLKDLHNTFDRALSPDKNATTPSPPPLLLSPTIMNKLPPDDVIKLDLEKTTLSPRNNYITSNENVTTLMPDILNEVEIRRRQQILIESEIKQFEQTVPPYVFLREIPNKPPPPYVPPSHGSPMTIIFPSEQRIKEITFRRTHELYDEILKTDKITDKNGTKDSTPTTSKINSILDENITNIYERIVLDICKECMQEYKKILTNLNPETYKNSLALFNPPDRLKCIQEFVYRNVRKLLSMEKKSNILQRNSIISIGRKKRDHVDEILIQELYEEEHKWTNFDQEEDEVKLAIVDEILNDIVKGVIGEITDINQKKLEFLTNFSSVNLNKE